MQTQIVRQALQLTSTATAPNTIERAPFRWSEDNTWRDNYARVDDSNRQRLKELGQQRREFQATRKASGDERAPMLSQDE